MPAFKITLYSTDCPKCQVLKKKLDKFGAPYTLISDVEEMKAKGFKSAPMLEVNGEVMDYSHAIKWVNSFNKTLKEQHTVWDGVHFGI